MDKLHYKNRLRNIFDHDKSEMKKLDRLIQNELVNNPGGLVGTLETGLDKKENNDPLDT